MEGYTTQRLAANSADFRVKEFRHVSTLDEAGMATVEQGLQKILDQVKANQEGLERLSTSEEERRLYDEYKSTWTSYLEEHQKIRALSRGNKNEEANAALRGKSFELFNRVTEVLTRLGELSEAAARSDLGLEKANVALCENDPVLDVLERRALGSHFERHQVAAERGARAACDSLP